MGRSIGLFLTLVLAGLRVFAAAAPTAAPPEPAAPPELPTDWIDSATGHRIMRLSREPGSSSLYFTQYAYTAGGTKLLMTSRRGIDLVTLGTGAIEHVLDGRVGRVIMAGRKTGAIFYTQGGAIFALDPATKQSRQLAKLPPGGSVVTVNSDETLAAGSITEGGDRPDLAPRLPMTLFAVNLQTGETKELLHTTDWINHFQFSPTDPTLLLYAHEGRQWKVDRVWLLRTDGHSEPKLVHQRTMKMEIAVHEYWSNDGQWVWYDLQTPLSEDYWIAGYNVYNGKRLWYHVPPNHWSVHYNTSPDGTLFSGDGSDEELHYAKAKDAKWMFLFHPELVPNQDGMTPDQETMIQTGRLVPERLVNLGKHDYSLEPNGNFTPDGNWIVFRSNMLGSTHIFAVEVKKSDRKD